MASFVACFMLSVLLTFEEFVLFPFGLQETFIKLHYLVQRVKGALVVEIALIVEVVDKLKNYIKD